MNHTAYLLNDSVFHIKPVEYVPYVSLVVSSSAFGTFGNFLIIGAILLNKELHTVTSMIILNLAITDLMVSVSAGIFTILTAHYGRDIFIRMPGLCKLAASACFVFCNVSFTSMSLLAFNRYMYICHNLKYNKIFSIAKTLFYCMSTWVTGVCLDLPYLLSIDGQVFEHTTHSCVFNTRKHKFYTNFLILSLLVTVGMILPAFYIKIFQSMIKSRSRTLGFNLYKKTEQKFLYKSTKGLFFSFLFFAFAFFPYFTLVLIKEHQTIIPRFVYLYMFWLARANSIFNPILYATTNSLFKRGFKKILAYLCCLHPQHFTQISQVNRKTSKFLKRSSTLTRIIYI